MRPCPQYSCYFQKKKKISNREQRQMFGHTVQLIRRNPHCISISPVQGYQLAMPMTASGAVCPPAFGELGRKWTREPGQW